MKFVERQSLQSLNTFGLPAMARTFTRVDTVDHLREALRFATERDLAVLLLGAGSNLILTRDFEGLVVQLHLTGIERQGESHDQVRLKAGAGENWTRLVEASLKSGLFGLENLIDIPGLAGAAPVQNIGAYGVELKDRLVEVEALHRPSGQLVTLPVEDCRLGYRDSVFKGSHRERFVITAITLQLDKRPRVQTGYGDIQDELSRMRVADPTPQDVALAVRRLRAARLPDPAALGSAGSFFKNPIVDRATHHKLKQAHPDLKAFETADGGHKLAAGWMIEQCGYKGLRRGPVGVHDQQALVLVNHGGATGKEVIALAEEIRDKVNGKFGVELEIEPRVI